MATASDIADAWEKDRQKSEAWLEDYVERNPDLVGVLIATSVKTSMDLGAGFVDVLRLGKGASDGGWGFAEDGLRIIGIVGPLGRGAKLVRSAFGARGARLIADPNPGAGICSWVNSTKALRQTGQKIYASVDEFARAALGPHGQISGISLTNMVATLRSVGARVRSVQAVNSLPDVTRMLPRDGSVVLVSVHVMNQGRRLGGHAVYAFYDALGRLRFSDRTGVYKSLSDVAQRYGATDLVPRAAAHMQNLFMKWVGPKGTATLAMAIDALIAPNESLVAEIDNPVQDAPRRQMSLPPQFIGKMPPVKYLTGVRARLMNLGYYDGEIRGPYDDRTRESVVAFQRANPPLAPDGIPGPKTQARLAQVYGS